MEGEGENLDEEIDLEEILNELELEEGEDSKEETVDEGEGADEDTVDEAKGDKEDLEEDRDFMKYCKENPYDPKCPGMQEAKGDKEEDLDEEMKPNYKAEDVQHASTRAEYVHEDKEFNLDALLEEINNLDENEDEDEVNEEVEETNEIVGAAIGTAAAGIMIGSLPLVLVGAAVQAKSPEEQKAWAQRHPKLSSLLGFMSGTYDQMKKGMDEMYEDSGNMASDEEMDQAEAELAKMMGENTHQEEIAELKAALEVKTTELNEVNLLNSKLLYVNRIFKANQLDEAQKLRVVETLDKADCIKEAKLIYETIKDTFNVANTKKASSQNKTKSIKEGLGMASKTVGTTAPTNEVIVESNSMVNRFQKLANIKINQ